MRIRLIVVAGIMMACALGWSADWITDGYDPQRTGWQRDEKILNKDNVKNLKILWKIQTDNKSRSMTALLPTLIVEKVNTSSGVKELAVTGGVSDNLYVIDVQAGKILWQKHFDSPGTNPVAGGILGPGGMTDTPTIGTPDANGRRIIYSIDGSGVLHQVDLRNGEDVAPPMQFLPGPGGKPLGLNLVGDTLYSIEHGGGNANSVMSIDLKDPAHTIHTWLDGTGGIWGRQGVAVGSDGTIYSEAGDGVADPPNGKFADTLYALDGKTLKLKDYYWPSNADWLQKRDLDGQLTPVVFPYKGRDLIVGGCKECRLWMVDSKSMGGPDHRTPLFRSELICNEDVNFASAGIWGNLASWQDAKGDRWVLMPFWGKMHSKFKFPVSYGPITKGAIGAFKVEEVNGKTQLTPQWVSRNMDQAEPPIIANGVVYAYGSGEDTDQAYPDVGLEDTADRRIPGSTHAVLYALDAMTGKELYNSGDQIKSFVHTGELSIANGRVYLGTFDDVLYSFGIDASVKK